MKLRQFKTLTDGVYAVSISTEDWSEADLVLIKKYGDPEIDLGGDFTGPPAFSLPADLVRIRGESPFVHKFDVRDDADAQDRADVWATEITARIVAAVAVLRASTDTFTGETVTNV